MVEVHPSQLVTGDEVSIRWSKDVQFATYAPFDVVVSYTFDLEWQTKEVIPVDEVFPRTEKVSLRGRLNLTVLTNIEFEIPEYVWIEVGIPFLTLSDGDRLMWLRRGKFLMLNDVSALTPDGLVQHQYSLLSQGSIVVESVQVTNTITTYWAGALEAISIDAVSSIDTRFSSIDFLRIF